MADASSSPQALFVAHPAEQDPTASSAATNAGSTAPAPAPESAVVVTTALAVTAGVLAVAVAATLLFLYIRRRRYLSLERIEQDLHGLEKSLEEWREQTSARDEQWRRSWHGEMASWQEYAPAAANVTEPPHARRQHCKRMSDPVMLSDNRPKSRSLREPDVLVPSRNMPTTPVRSAAMSHLRMVDVHTAGGSPRLSVFALRTLAPNRSSFLYDSRIRPFTTASDAGVEAHAAATVEGVHADAPMSPRSGTTMQSPSPLPAVVVIEEARHFDRGSSVFSSEPGGTWCRTRTDTMDSDMGDEGQQQMELPMPEVIRRLTSNDDNGPRRASEMLLDAEAFIRDTLDTGSALSPLSSRPSQESIHLDEFNVDFPLPSPTWSRKELADAPMHEGDEQDTRRFSQPDSLTTDETVDDMDEDMWDADADAQLLNETCPASWAPPPTDAAPMAKDELGELTSPLAADTLSR